MPEHAKLFKHLLDRLQALQTDVGVSHTYNNIPWVCAGSCGGYLKTGQYIDAGGVTHNQFHNTILSAVTGELVEDFGDPELEPGVIDAMIA